MTEVLIRTARVVPLGDEPAPPGAAEPVDLLVRDGVIAEIAPRVEATGCLELEADGRWVIPGLWDQHVHMTQWARTFARIDLVGTRSPHEVIERLLPALEDPSGIVVGFGYRTASWTEQPTVALLDSVARETPVVLISGDAHNGWLSTAAQRLLGAPASTGTIAEYDWFPVMARLDDLPRDEIAEQGALGAAIARASELGVVGITDLEFSRCWERWPSVYAQGLRSLRVRAADYPDALDDVIREGLRTGDHLEHGEGLLTMGPLKVIADGSLNTRTAYCCTPYVDDPTVRGALNLEPDELTELLVRADRHGLRAAVHSIGDAASHNQPRGLRAQRRPGHDRARPAAGGGPRRGDGAAARGRQRAARPPDRRPRRHRAVLVRPQRAVLHAALHARGRRHRAAGVRRAGGPAGPVAGHGRSGPPQRRRARALEPRRVAHPAEALRASVPTRRAVDVGDVGDLVLLDHDPLAQLDTSRATAERLRTTTVATTIVAGRVVHDAR